MAGPPEDLCKREITGQAFCHAWLVCLSERHHGDRRPILLLESTPCCYSYEVLMGCIICKFK